MLFSQRMGIKPVKDVIQVDSMDDDLRNSLWNILNIVIWNTKNNEVRFSFAKYLWISYFKKPIDDIPIAHDIYGNLVTEGIYNEIRSYFFCCSWNEVYDFIETCTQQNEAAIGPFNAVLEKELSGYRFIEGKIAPITDKNEMESIQEAANTKFKNVNEHINTAIIFLSDKKKPDYRNSIKESISAVEAICKIYTNDKKATLGMALNKLERAGQIHSLLKSSFDKLYAYTNDGETGIRHALLEDSKYSITFADAKYMLVACSAFINYLKEKLSKTK